jgi:hypothetical protein
MESVPLSFCLREPSGGTTPAPMPADPQALLLAAVLDPAAARPSGRLRPLVLGWPHPVVRFAPPPPGWAGGPSLPITAGTGWRH